MNYKNSKPEDIKIRTFKFSIMVIEFCRTIQADTIYKIIINQVVRSVTSIGANLEEATGSRTKAEFIHSTNIAKKEARETYYWLKILFAISSNSIKEKLSTILVEANEIVSILTASIIKLEKTKKSI